MTPQPTFSRISLEKAVSQRDARRRSKVTRACDSCKSKKKRCTGDFPCATCRRLGKSCTYDATYNRGIVGPPSPAPSAVGRGSSGIDRIMDRWDVARSNAVTSEEDTAIGTSLRTNMQTTANRSRSPVLRASPALGQAPVESAETDQLAGQYHGPTSAHFFLGRAWRPLEQHSSPATPAQTDVDGATSIFAFGDRTFPHADGSRPAWPSDAAASEFIRVYFEYASPTYRILHRATTEKWVNQMHEARHNRSKQVLSTATEAVVFLIFATSLMYRIDADGNVQDADENNWKESEQYYAEAQRLLDHETGAPSLESVQARFLIVLWLLSTSRMNQAWFSHGTMVQLILAMGLHRSRAESSASTEDAQCKVKRECQRRTLWCSYSLDKYISLILGRPSLLRLEDIDQPLPSHVNDEDLMTDKAITRPGRDCVMTAPVMSALLAQILARSFRDQYAITGISDRQQIEASMTRIDELTAWQAMLPPFLSGAVHASSLIPGFRRQHTVVRLAYAHSTMFVTRPLLLRDYSQVVPEYESAYSDQIVRCLRAALDAIDTVMGSVSETPLFPHFWHSQYATFNALSIIYIFLIQVSKGRIPIDNLRALGRGLDEVELFKLAEVSQQHLAKATARNAPAWRYSVILEGLRNEVRRLMRTASGPTRNTSQDPGGAMEAVAASRYSAGPLDSIPNSSSTVDLDTQLTGGDLSNQSTVYSAIGGAVNASIEEVYGLNPLGDFTTDTGDLNFSLDFWPQLDSLPLSYLGHNHGEPGM